MYDVSVAERNLKKIPLPASTPPGSVCMMWSYLVRDHLLVGNGLSDRVPMAETFYNGQLGGAHLLGIGSPSGNHFFVGTISRNYNYILLKLTQP